MKTYKSYENMKELESRIEGPKHPSLSYLYFLSQEEGEDGDGGDYDSDDYGYGEDSDGDYGGYGGDYGED